MTARQWLEANGKRPRSINLYTKGDQFGWQFDGGLGQQAPPDALPVQIIALLPAAWYPIESDAWAAAEKAYDMAVALGWKPPTPPIGGCPNCGHTRARIGSADAIFWCPRCGSVVVRSGSGTEEYMPRLVSRARTLCDLDMPEWMTDRIAALRQLREDCTGSPDPTTGR